MIFRRKGGGSEPNHQDKPKIGVVLCGDSRSGGQHSYENSILDILSKSSLNLVLYIESEKDHQAYPSNLSVHNYRVTFLDKIRKIVISNSRIIPRILTTTPFMTSLEKKLLVNGVDLAYFVSPNHLAAIFQKLPMINTVWDIGHRDLPEYPEFRSLQIYRNRDNYLSEVLPRSVHIFTDSETTSSKLSWLYGVDSKRVTSIGLFPQVFSKNENMEKPIKKDVVIYPANFWPHKNHEILFKAMDVIVKKYPCKLILTAASDFNAEKIISRMRSLYPNVIFECFIGLRKFDLEKIIQESKVLVMPSSLGPTNLPPLEALMLGTRVVISDAHKDKIFLENPNVKVVDPFNISQFASAILETLEKPEFTLVNKEMIPAKHSELLETLNLVASKVQ